MHEMRGSLFLCFCLFFNGRLNFQIWHHKAKAPKSHPEGWCSLDCGRFRRGFNSFSFSITMPKKKKKTRWNSACCKVYSISHFFSFASSIRRTQEEKKKPCYFFFLFSFISRTWCRGREGRGWETQQAPKKLVIINKNKEEKRKSKQNKNTHTHREWTPAHELKKKKKNIQALDGRVQRWVMSYMKYPAQIFDPCASPGYVWGRRCKKSNNNNKKRPKQPS